jgi:nucleoside 2-deoxyribosyltransferase
MLKKKAFVICSVRKATAEMLEELDRIYEKYTKLGYDVYLPHKRTNQEGSGYAICTENYEAISKANIVIVVYYKESTGTHFDMGMAFALGKEIIVEHALIESGGKHYARMLMEWERLGIE